LKCLFNNLTSIFVDCFCETNTFVSEIKDSVIRADEDISKDVKRSDLRREIESDESRDAISRNIQDILLCGQSERLSCQLDSDVWKIVDDVARREDSFSVDDDCSEFGVESIDLLGRTSDEGSTSVTDGLAVRLAESQRIVSQFEIAGGEFPVGLGGDVDVGEVSGVSCRVGSSENHFSSVLSSWIVGEPEAEDWLLDESLGQDVVPDWCDVVDGDGLEGKSEYSIEFCCDPGDS